MQLFTKVILITAFSGHLLYAYSGDNILDDRVSIRFENSSVKEALQLFSTQTNYKISYANAELPVDRRISKVYQNEKVSTIIRDLWGDDDLTLRAIGNAIIIKVTQIQKKVQEKGNLGGTITDDKNNPLPGVTIQLQDNTIGDITDQNGEFIIPNLGAGSYTLIISSLGFQKTIRKINVVSARTTDLSVSLNESAEELDEIVVTGTTVAHEISQQPLQVSSINMLPLQNETADVVNILDRTTGVHTRQSGGFGAYTIIQLNGFSGRSVRIYYDGIPLELYGSALQLNNLPPTIIDRIDVYKGAMPIDVGTDALAGGINIISKQVDQDYLDVSYQIGSFNTHNATINLSKRLSEKLYFSLTGFYNYADNDYEINAIQRLPNFTEEEVKVNRFHSAHESYLMQGTLGLVDQSWADELKYSIGINGRDDEIQHGVRLPVVPAGDATLNTFGLAQNLTYKKNLFNDKLNLHYFGSYIVHHESIRDSTLNQYDWFGDVVASRSSDVAEIFVSPTQRDGKSDAHAHRLGASYTLALNHLLKISSFYTRQMVEGEDAVQIERRGFDPNGIPSRLSRLVSGISYESKWFNKQLETIVFGKFYYYNQSIEDFRLSDNPLVRTFRQSDHTYGAGVGAKYIFKDDLYLKTSFESTIRIPDANEVFGDFLTIEPNFLLQPERSNNINFGGYYRHKIGGQKSVILDLNLFLRHQQNLIRLEPGRNVNDPAQFINEDRVLGRGVELSTKLNLIDNFEFTSNLTFQNLKRAGEPTVGNTNGVGFAIPNIPFNFFNLEGRYKVRVPWSQEDQLSIFSYFTFVEEFDLILQPNRNPDNVIPTQKRLDFGLNYAWKEPGLTFSFQVNNVLNQEVFDNYRIPNPGRNYAFKIRYQRFKI
ncbi:MAG: TonB-dependent receptor [Bacteroidota bacterium]